MTPIPAIRPDVQKFLDLLAANPRPKMSNDNIASLRPLAAGGMALIDRPIGELAITTDHVIAGPGGDLALRLFDCRNTREAGPIVVFFHGGGFVIGDLDTHASMCAEISRSLDLPVVAVGYRLAPENPWPAAPDDAEAGARWVAANAAVLGRTSTGIVLCGDSAGATLTLVTALALRDTPAEVPVIGQIALYPGADTHGEYASKDLFATGFGLDRSDTVWFGEAYGQPADHWRAAPLHADLKGVAPTVLVTAELDPLRDQGRAYAAKLVQAGVETTFREVRGQIHGFANYRRVIASAHDDFVSVLAVAKASLLDQVPLA